MTACRRSWPTSSAVASPLSLRLAILLRLRPKLRPRRSRSPLALAETRSRMAWSPALPGEAAMIGLVSSRAGKAGISSNRSSDQLAGDQRWIEVVHRDQHLQILEGNQVKIPPLTPRTANRRGEDGVQRWHAGAEGSSAQIREGCLSCVRYRVTAKSTRRIAMTTQILVRNIKGWNHAAIWLGSRKSAALQRAGPRHMCFTLDYSRKARPSLPHRKQLGARGLVPEERPRRSGAKYTGHQLAEGRVFRPSAAGQFGNSERGDPVPPAASG